MKSFFGKNQIKTDLPELLYDESRYTCGIPEAVFFPETIFDLQNILSQASSSLSPVVFIGAQTGTTGGSVPIEDSHAVCFSSMNKILSIENAGDNPILWCEPGVTLASIDEFLIAPARFSSQITNSDLLEGENWFYPPDPTETTAQIGGTAATNASGARSYHFGPTRKHIAAAQIVFASGEKATLYKGKNLSDSGFSLLTENGRKIVIPVPPHNGLQIKNAAGYFSGPGMDLLDLFIGSEGTLCAFSKIGIRLEKRPVFIGGLSFFPSCEAAFDFADFLRSENQVASIEYFDPSSLEFLDKHRSIISKSIPDFPFNTTSAVLWEYIENNPVSFESKFSEWEKALQQNGSSFDTTWSGLDKREADRLKQFRHAIPEIINATVAQNKLKYDRIRKIGTDTALPARRFREVYGEYIRIIKQSGIPYAAFGHLGDNHIHINLIPDTAEALNRAINIYDELMEITIANGGTVSAEHGIGKLKRDYLVKMYGKDTFECMRSLKTALDPLWLLNPGNLFASPQSDGDPEADHFPMRKL